jgi:hypothetical protein
MVESVITCFNSHTDNFELIRPVNIKITNVKKILRSYAVPYLNINIVKSTLYMGLKSQDFKDYFEQLLQMDLFS